MNHTARERNRQKHKLARKRRTDPRQVKSRKRRMRRSRIRRAS